MPDKPSSSLPFESSDAAEQGLWAALAELPQGEPSPELRRRFHRRLEQAERARWPLRLRDWLGLDGKGGWITASACLLLGFGLAQSFSPPGDGSERLAALEGNVALLQRELILDRLQDDSAGTRLKGVLDASAVAAGDHEVARALLLRASEDRSPSVRSAAIDALGPQLRDEALGDELMALLEAADSPIVQLALVDLVLREGTAGQQQELQRLAASGGLHPDLVKHVHKAFGSQTT